MIKYCESIFETKRRLTREVMVGNVGVGGDNPIRIQSMTTSSTRDVQATIDQIKRLADRGCEIARVTVQGMKEADACEQIKNGLLQQGYTIPIVADIHFYPPAAMQVVNFVDKVRINPGNFVDKRASFKIIEYDDATYTAELQKIEEKFTPLVEKCKQLKRAMRIGTNHGSLSDRIMNRYGDTPFGMVESALEFARICRKNNYHDFVFSMKSSNPQVMIQAYRLLTASMYELGWDYPLHLGVTEAGDGEDGRVKSAMGIGALLLDGIGDTIRVSLTEDPWFEIDPCQRLVRIAQSYQGQCVAEFDEKFRKIDQIERRIPKFPPNLNSLALHTEGSVFLSVNQTQILDSNFYQSLSCEGTLGKPKLKATTTDSIIIQNQIDDPKAKKKIEQLTEMGMGCLPYESIKSLDKALVEDRLQEKVKRFVTFEEKKSPLIVEVDSISSKWPSLVQLQPDLILFAPKKNRVHAGRQFFEWLRQHQINCPVILHFSYNCQIEDLVHIASMEYGSLFCDGLGDGIWLEGQYPLDNLRQLSFSILQAARRRMSKTDFISCPSCGRTLFNLQDVTKRIQSRTAHLPGVKIAIMGCIVNGPGEMADADFGYVGSKAGKIDLYVGKECIERDIDFSEADDRLVDLIKAHGKWKEPEAESGSDGKQENKLEIEKEITG